MLSFEKDYQYNDSNISAIKDRLGKFRKKKEMVFHIWLLSSNVRVPGLVPGESAEDPRVPRPCSVPADP